MRGPRLKESDEFSNSLILDNLEPASYARLLHIPVASAVTRGLGVHARGYRAAHTVLDGDGLHGGGVSQGDRSGVEGALCGRSAAVEGVVDACTGLSRHGYLSALGELSFTCEGGSCYSGSLGTTASVGATS